MKKHLLFYFYFSIFDYFQARRSLAGRAELLRTEIGLAKMGVIEL